MHRLLIACLIALAAIYGIAWTASLADAAEVCDPVELGQLRFLTQLYGRQRTDVEFALARAEHQRQTLERQMRELEMKLKGLSDLLEATKRAAPK